MARFLLNTFLIISIAIVAVVQDTHGEIVLTSINKTVLLEDVMCDWDMWLNEKGDPNIKFTILEELDETYRIALYRNMEGTQVQLYEISLCEGVAGDDFAEIHRSAERGGQPIPEDCPIKPGSYYFKDIQCDFPVTAEEEKGTIYAQIVNDTATLIDVCFEYAATLAADATAVEKTLQKE